MQMRFACTLMLSCLAIAMILGGVMAVTPNGSDIATLESFQDIQGLDGSTAEIDPRLSGSGFQSFEGDSGGQQYPESEQADLSGTSQAFMNPAISGAERFQLQFSAQPYVVANPSTGDAPLTVNLQVPGMEQTAFWHWELDWEGDGYADTSGQGPPSVQATYDRPGSYAPTFTFYDNNNRIMAQAKGLLTVTGQGQQESDAGTQSQALTALPSGSGLIRGGGGQASGQSRPRVDLGEASWTAPEEVFTEDLRPELYVFPERGSAPLTVRFDASATFSRYGVYRYNYDVAWGPDSAPDDGYYLYSGSDPRWTHTFEEYGSYLVILDVEDNRGERSRTTNVVFVLDAGIAPTARISANTTNGSAPLTVAFSVQPAVEHPGYEAANAYWDFDLSTSEPPEGGDLAAYKNMVHTYNMPGDYAAGVMLSDGEGNFGTMVRMAIHVTAPDKPEPSSSGGSLQGQTMPVLRVVANRTSGPAPLAVEFDISSSYLADEQGRGQTGKILGASFDPDGSGPAPRNDILGLKWTYLYERPGLYEAEVMAIDGERRRSEPQVIRIDVKEAAFG